MKGKVERKENRASQITSEKTYGAEVVADKKN